VTEIATAPMYASKQGHQVFILLAGHCIVYPSFRSFYGHARKRNWIFRKQMPFLSHPIVLQYVKVEDYKCNHVRFEVFTAVTMKNGVFWDVTPSGSCKNRRFGGT
jgi:hypothetical protein